MKAGGQVVVGALVYVEQLVAVYTGHEDGRSTPERLHVDRRHEHREAPGIPHPVGVPIVELPAADRRVAYLDLDGVVLHLAVGSGARGQHHVVLVRTEPEASEGDGRIKFGGNVDSEGAGYGSRIPCKNGLADRVVVGIPRANDFLGDWVAVGVGVPGVIAPHSVAVQIEPGAQVGVAGGGVGDVDRELRKLAGLQARLQVSQPGDRFFVVAEEVVIVAQRVGIGLAVRLRIDRVEVQRGTEIDLGGPGLGQPVESAVVDQKGWIGSRGIAEVHPLVVVEDLDRGVGVLQRLGDVDVQIADMGAGEVQPEPLVGLDFRIAVDGERERFANRGLTDLGDHQFVVGAVESPPNDEALAHQWEPFIHALHAGDGLDGRVGAEVVVHDPPHVAVVDAFPDDAIAVNLGMGVGEAGVGRNVLSPVGGNVVAEDVPVGAVAEQGERTVALDEVDRRAGSGGQSNPIARCHGGHVKGRLGVDRSGDGGGHLTGGRRRADVDHDAGRGGVAVAVEVKLEEDDVGAVARDDLGPVRDRERRSLIGGIGRGGANLQDVAAHSGVVALPDDAGTGDLRIVVVELVVRDLDRVAGGDSGVVGEQECLVVLAVVARPDDVVAVDLHPTVSAGVDGDLDDRQGQGIAVLVGGEVVEVDFVVLSVKAVPSDSVAGNLRIVVGQPDMIEDLGRDVLRSAAGHVVEEDVLVGSVVGPPGDVGTGHLGIINRGKRVGNLRGDAGVDVVEDDLRIIAGKRAVASVEVHRCVGSGSERQQVAGRGGRHVEVHLGVDRGGDQRGHPVGSQRAADVDHGTAAARVSVAVDVKFEVDDVGPVARRHLGPVVDGEPGPVVARIRGKGPNVHAAAGEVALVPYPNRVGSRLVG